MYQQLPKRFVGQASVASNLSCPEMSLQHLGMSKLKTRQDEHIQTATAIL